MNSPVQPYVFSQSFSPAPQPEVSNESEALGYARGYDDGLAAATAQSEQRIAASLERLEQALAGAAETGRTRWQALEADAARLALTFAELLCDALPPGSAALEQAFAQALADVRAGDSLTIRLAPAAATRLKPAIDQLALHSDAAAIKIEMTADPAMPAQDFALEWRNGAIRRDRKALVTRINAAIARSFPGAADNSQNEDQP